MGFLEDDDADCLFKVADQLNRKKSNTVEYAKRGRPQAIRLHQIGEYETIEEQETHQESEGSTPIQTLFAQGSRHSGASRKLSNGNALGASGRSKGKLAINQLTASGSSRGKTLNSKTKTPREEHK